MSFFCRLSRKHYWCTPHRSVDRRLVQVCYECGAERPAHDFQDDLAKERLNQSLIAARSEVVRLESPLSGEPAGSPERIAVGQEPPRKFQLVK
jgi:hypothetical protein